MRKKKMVNYPYPKGIGACAVMYNEWICK